MNKFTRPLLISGTILLLFFAFHSSAHAATYYVDNCVVTGNDSNLGTSSSTPWLTIAKVNSSTFSAGDSILFESGCKWQETLTMPSSGSASGGVITFSTYGTGSNPYLQKLDRNSQSYLSFSNNIDFGPWLSIGRGDILGGISYTGLPAAMVTGLGYSNIVVLATDNGKVYRYSNGTLAKVGDGGQTGNAASMFITSQGTLLASWATGVWRSTNNGDTWTQVITFSQPSGSSFNFTEDDQYSLYTGQYQTTVTTSSVNLYKSTNDGATWTDITPAGWQIYRHIHEVYWDKYRSQLLVAVGDPGIGGLWVSTDHGNTFTQKTSMPDVVAMASDAQYMYFGEDGGSTRRIFRTTDFVNLDYRYNDGTITQYYWKWGFVDENGYIAFVNVTDSTSTPKKIVYSSDHGDNFTAITGFGNSNYLGTFALPSAYYTHWDGFYYGGGSGLAPARWRLYPARTQFTASSSGNDYTANGVASPWKTIDALNFIEPKNLSGIQLSGNSSSSDSALVLKTDGESANGNGYGITTAKPAAPAFTSGLEGVDPYSSLTQSSGTVTWNSTDLAHSGTYSTKFAATATNPTLLAAVTTGSFGSGSTYWVSGYLYVSSTPTGVWSILKTGSTDFAMGIGVGINTDKSLYVSTASLNGGNYSILNSRWPVPTVPTGQWVKIKMRVYVHPTLGTITVWQNDRIVVNAVGLSTFLTGKTFGLFRWGLAAAQSDALAYWDDLAVGATDPDQYYGITALGNDISVKDVFQSTDVTFSGNNSAASYNVLNGASFSIGSAASSTKLLNNTIFGGTTGITDSGQYSVLRNDIVSGQSTYAVNSSGSSLTEDHNDWNGTVSGFSPAASDLNSSPLFTSTSTPNFFLLSSSPIIDAGANLGSTYQMGLSWPSNLITLNQNSYGPGWDMGAYVYTQTSTPSVVMTAPTTSSTVSGTVTVSASSTAVSPAAVSSVQFYLDGSTLGTPITSTSSPNTYSYSWNTASSTDGSHTLYALATDNYSNTATSTSISVTVANVPILSVATSTSLNFTAAHGSTATSSQSVVITNSGVVGTTLNWSATSTQSWLTFSPASSSLAGGASTSVAFIVNPATLALGTYNATATIAGTSASSSPQTLPVSLSITATGIAVSIISPVNGATVSSMISVTASPTSSVGITSVQFLLDGSPLGSLVTSSPYMISWNTASSSDGFHILVASTTDTNSNTATSSYITVTIDNTPPVRSSGSPSGWLPYGTTNTTLSLTTDETATCKYSTSAGTAFASMTVFSSTASTTHQTAISGLQSGQSYTYYVKCEDNQGNTNTDDYPIAFAVNGSPAVSVGVASAYGIPNYWVTPSPTSTASSSPSSPPSSTASSTTTASSTADLQALINSLTAQLNALRAQWQELASASSSSTLAFTRNLGLWDRGAGVQALQEFLISQASGPAADKLKTHGASQIFGLLTYHALVEFQKKAGIVPSSGYFGPKTRAYVNAHD